jgi:membrane protein YqaA with SNARE-associated domain
MFSWLYQKVLAWARHKRAIWYLSALSFAESSFFPVPPDVMLAPMALAWPERALRYALVTTVASVLGGVLGYGIGTFAFDLIEPWIHTFGYWGKYTLAQQWFEKWGFWAVFLAGFSPIPYKVFTIAAGVLSMPFLPFVVASFFGRGGRFFLVALLLAWGGKPLETTLQKYIDRIGWATVALVIIGIAVYKI